MCGNIAQIGAAGMKATGSLAVTKIAADTMHRTTKGMKKTKTTKGIGRLAKKAGKTKVSNAKTFAQLKTGGHSKKPKVFM